MRKKFILFGLFFLYVLGAVYFIYIQNICQHLFLFFNNTTFNVFEGGGLNISWSFKLLLLLTGNNIYCYHYLKVNYVHDLSAL